MDHDPRLHALALGAVITHLRESKGWSQASLAERAAMTKSMMSRIEKGQGSVKTTSLASLAKALELEPAYVMTLIEHTIIRFNDFAKVLFDVQDWSWRTLMAPMGPLGMLGLVHVSVAALLKEEKRSRKRGQGNPGS